MDTIQGIIAGGSPNGQPRYVVDTRNLIGTIVNVGRKESSIGGMDIIQIIRYYQTKESDDNKENKIGNYSGKEPTKPLEECPK